jgi:hypothetical protein
MGGPFESDRGVERAAWLPQHDKFGDQERQADCGEDVSGHDVCCRQWMGVVTLR